MKKTPKQKTSIYIDKEHLQTIQEMKDKYNLSVNRTINLCLKNYLPEIQEGKCVLWIWCNEWNSNKRPMDSSRHRWTQTEILRLVGWYSWPTWRWTESQQQSWERRKTPFQNPWYDSFRSEWQRGCSRLLCNDWTSWECWRMKCERHCENWTFGADWKEQINEWKETEKRDWETAESDCSVEGCEVGSGD